MNSNNYANGYLKAIVPGNSTPQEIIPLINLSTPGAAINPSNWIRVNGRFKATGNETQITLGTFQVSQLLIVDPQGSPNNAYYFVDNVSLSQVPDAGPNKVYCGNGVVLGESNTCGLPQGLTTTYSWSPTTGLSNASILNPIASPSVTTLYTLSVKIGDLDPYTSTVTVTVPNGPIAPLIISPSGPLSICPNEGVTLTASGGPSSTYTWSNNVVGGYNITPNPYSITFNTTRTFTVTSNAGGCIATATKLVTVNPNPVITITSSPNTSSNNPICAETPVILSATSNLSGTTYSWHQGGSTINTSTVFPVTSPSQSYVVTGTSNNCSASRNFTVFVKPKPNSFSITSNSPVCQGQSASLAVAPVQSGVTYTWSPGGGTGSSLTTTGPINTATTYTATATLNGCIRSNTATITATPAPNLQVSPATCNGNGTLTFTASGASTYTWIPTGGAWPGPVSITSSSIYTTPTGSTATNFIVATNNGCGVSNVNISANPSCCRSYFVNGNGYKDETNPSGETAVIVLDSNNPGWPDYHLIDAGGGQVTFDGIYLVTCPLKLVNGTFEFAPGTELYFDAMNFSTTATVCSDFGLDDYYNFLQFGEEYGDEVIVEMNSAKFAATCGQMWGGMYAKSNVMVTCNSSTIRDAYIGMAFHSECLMEPNTAYYINDSDFTDNIIGLWDHNRLEAPTFPNPVYITNSRFTAQFPLPWTYQAFDYASTGVYFGLSYPYTDIDYSQAKYSDNTFTGLRDYGMAGHANQVVIGPNNYFENIGYAAIAVDGGGQNGLVTIDNNIINITPDWVIQGVPTTNPVLASDIVVGIEANYETIIQNNNIFGGVTPTYPGGFGTVASPSMIGVYSWENPVRTLINTNIFHNLNEGVSSDYSSPYGLGINNNQFTDVLNGVFLRGASSNSSFRPSIGCNSFVRDAAADPLVGIGTDINAWLSDLYVYNGNFIGNGNDFSYLDNGAG
ncbi:MAG: hypothetical protein EOP51_21750, partial [Sphingobacteriales bacterium]